MKNIILYLTVIAVLTSCSNDDDPIVEPGDVTGLLENQKIDIGNEERGYHLYIPKSATNAPVVMLLHANKSNNNEIIGLGTAGFNRPVKAPYKVWLDIAEQEDLILIVPNGTIGTSNDRGWNDCRNDASGNPDSNDVSFISTLIDYVLNEYQADPSKVYAVGTSNGGHMAMRLAHEIPNKLKAFAAIVASNPENSQCANSTIPISALFMNGTEDPINPFEGGDMAGNRGKVFSAQATIDYWVNRNQTDTMPMVTDFADSNTADNCTIKKHLYSNGTNNTEVAFYEIVGGGHTEPSIRERYSNLFKEIVKEQNGDIEMATEVWNFFKTK